MYIVAVQYKLECGGTALARPCGV